MNFRLEDVDNWFVAAPINKNGIDAAVVPTIRKAFSYCITFRVEAMSHEQVNQGLAAFCDFSGLN